MASAAAAADIDVTASLEVTDGWARVGAYVPVTLRVTNNTDRTVEDMHVATGGPVDYRFPTISLAAGDSVEEAALPLFYVGGEMALDLTFYDAKGACIARTRAEVPEVRTIPDDAAVLWLLEDAPEPTAAQREALVRRFGRKRLHIFRPGRDLGFFKGVLLGACGLVDVFGRPAGSDAHLRLEPQVPPVPGVRDMVQPATYLLLKGDPEEADARLRLWLALAVFAGAALAVSVACRRRRVLTVAGLLALALAATVIVWSMGGGDGRSRLREWTLCWEHTSEQVAYEEQLVLLESSGPAFAGFRLEQVTPLPLPIFASPDAVFRPFGVVHAGQMQSRDTNPLFQARQPRCAAHVFRRPYAMGLAQFARTGPMGEPPPELAEWPDVVAALLVEGGDATDANGRTQPIDAWAVAWKTGGDADLAWAGRSLAWWDRHRRTGDGPFLVAWIRDPAPEPPAGIDVYERLPAMVVYGP